MARDEEGVVKVDVREDSDVDAPLMGANAPTEFGDVKRPTATSKAVGTMMGAAFVGGRQAMLGFEMNCWSEARDSRYVGVG